jgi:hypothetical protein
MGTAGARRWEAAMESTAVTLPSADLNRLLTAFVCRAREQATRPGELAKLLTLRTHVHLQEVLVVCLQEPLLHRSLAPLPAVLAKVTVDTLQETCDLVYRPSAWAKPERFLQQRFKQPPRYDAVRLWTAARLKWFAGGTIATVAEHLAVSEETVKRDLAEAGPMIDQFWLARFAPQAPYSRQAA